MGRACLPPLDRASFASGGQFISPLQGAAAAEPGRWTLELLRDHHITPEELMRLVNDFLATPDSARGRKRPSS
jgi:hypothetical protein